MKLVSETLEKLKSKQGSHGAAKVATAFNVTGSIVQVMNQMSIGTFHRKMN